MATKAKIKLLVVAATLVGTLITANVYMYILNTANPNISSSQDLLEQPLEPFQIYHMKDFIVEYYEKSESSCFIRGSMASSPSKCDCLPGWHGPSCDIPHEIFRSVLVLNQTIERRLERPRRLIFVLPINETLQRTMETMRNLRDIVDVFVHGSFFNSTTMHNQALQNESNREFGHQTLFVWNLGEGDSHDGGLSKPLRDLVLRAFFHLSEVRMDDLVAFSRRHQVPSRNALLFLKLHDNYPEQIVLNYPKPAQYSYDVSIDVCTVASLIRCCQFDISKLQAAGHVDQFSNFSTRWVMS